MTPEEHEATLEAPKEPTTYTLVRQAEIGMALPILRKVDALFKEALQLQGELAAVLAADNGLFYEEGTTIPRFHVDAEGVTLHLFYPSAD
jgi:hypothetical protein